MRVLYWYYRTTHINKKGVAPVMMRITNEGQRLSLNTHMEIEEK